MPWSVTITTDVRVLQCKRKPFELQWVWPQKELLTIVEWPQNFNRNLAKEWYWNVLWFATNILFYCLKRRPCTKLQLNNVQSAMFENFSTLRRALRNCKTRCQALFSIYRSLSSRLNLRAVVQLMNSCVHIRIYRCIFQLVRSPLVISKSSSRHTPTVSLSVVLQTYWL